MKHNLGLADAPRADLKRRVLEWFDQARPHVTTQDFDTTWFDFLHAWGNARYPLGADLAQIAHNNSKDMPMPAAANQYENPDLQRLVATCAALQKLQGDDPFSISCSQAARLLWGDCSATDAKEWRSRRRKAHRWLRGLTADDVLVVAEAGKPGPAGSPATRYRYIAEAPAETLRGSF